MSIQDPQTRLGPEAQQHPLEQETTAVEPKPRWWYDGISYELIVWIVAISARKHITVFAEFASDGLLDWRLHEILAHYLPVDEDVLQKIESWSDSLDQFDKAQEISDEPIDWRPFTDEGYHLAVSLKQALPDWTVHYADQLLYYEAPDGGFCPEVFLDGSLGLCQIDAYKSYKVRNKTPAIVWPKPSQRS
jgi:hypothetical protein